MCAGKWSSVHTSVCVMIFIYLVKTCQIRNSVKLKEIMKKILLLGNTLNQGTARGNMNFLSDLYATHCELLSITSAI